MQGKSRSRRSRDERPVRPDPADLARDSGLRHVCDDGPGYRRRRRGRGFRYHDEQGRPIRDDQTLGRIRSLAIPPAWTDVWICPSPRGHLQATGRDAKGRKQYRYHPRWAQVRDETKFHRMIPFGEALPRIRRAVARDLARAGLPKAKVLALLVRLLERTRIRVGNEAYRRENRSYGLTTLRDQHVEIDGSRLVFRFRGKSGQRQRVALADGRLARVVRRCRDVPGQELFQFVCDDGSHQPVDSGDVNEYLRGIAGEEFTAKDFRTWAGTLEAALALQEIGPAPTKTQRKKNVVEAVRRTAERLGNRPATCRKYYIHPAVPQAYLAGRPLAMPEPRAGANGDPSLHPEEHALLRFLRDAARSPHVARAGEQ